MPPQRDTVRRRWYARPVVVGLVVGLLVAAVSTIVYHADSSTALGYLIVGWAMAGGAWAGITEDDAHATERARQRDLQTQQAAKALSAAASASHDPDPAEFLAYWQYTHTRLNSFHQEASLQIRSAYRLAQVTSVLGFLVVVALGVAPAWPSANTTQTLVAGALAAIAAAMSAYIGRTFQETYRQALQQSMTFFDQPVVASRLLAAERLVGRLHTDDAKDEALLMIIAAAAAAPAAPRFTAPTSGTPREA